ncbi:glycosyltransferase family 15 protein [Suillus bovinus]|uniref:glycosyltransferase family 15 protein n=1 Tax=Suillus bovinus TaxID=48563 RepID=UPI001B8707A4|nr:glycosyltransferase family 15 protein [Suillus bovinus]KAG2137162.1 glycosyltransferase family 15 protein [Suillus bovinus]
MALPLTAAHRRYIVIAVTTVLIVSYFMSASKNKPSPSLGNMIPQISPPPHKANTTLVILARNTDLSGVISSVEQLEAKFNRKFSYPWVFLNDEPFSTDFKRRVSVLTNANVSFGLIPREHWVQPDWIDEGRAQEGRNKLVRHGVIYGSSVSYRNMCRFNSGFFFRHELLTPYKWYWRVEPDVRYYCDLDYDPFVFMKDHTKVYGFTISMPGKFSSLMVNDAHSVWSNFEIADMDFWRSEAYTKFFEHLDNTGGFYYERWGDAPVHSIAAALFTRKDQIHFFKDIGYKHAEFAHCPQGKQWREGHCSCDPNDNFDFAQNSCLRHLMRLDD